VVAGAATLERVEPAVTRSIEIAAAPHAVWTMVTDLPRMADFSPENIGGRWVGGSGPAVGVRFRGTNRNGRREWHTKVRVVVCEPDRLFTFDVRTPFGLRVSRWSYELAATGSGCLLTERWYRAGNWFIRRVLGPRVTGRADRPGYNAYSIEHTLAAVKARADAHRV
jgi:hypothetical protein